MDPTRFDALARSLAAPKTRRGLLGGAAALLAGLAGVRSAGAQVTQDQCGNTSCKNNPGKCAAGCVCCVYANGNSRCRPPGTCAPGEVSCPAGQVLGPSGVCAAPTTTTTVAPTTTPAPTTTTAAPTTTTTTIAPTTAAPTTTTTTTSTTTAAPTTTTTTTTTATPTTTTTTAAPALPPPPQGICPTGADICRGATVCGGVSGQSVCVCVQTTSGLTACISPPPTTNPATPCAVDADCGGSNRYCIALCGEVTDPETGQVISGFCAPACTQLTEPPPPPSSTTTPPPLQSTCPTGAGFCGTGTLCGRRPDGQTFCVCGQTKSGLTACVGAPPTNNTATPCTADADCGALEPYCIDLCREITDPETGQVFSGFCASACL